MVRHIGGEFARIAPLVTFTLSEGSAIREVGENDAGFRICRGQDGTARYRPGSVRGLLAPGARAGEPAGMALPTGREQLRDVQILIVDDYVLYRDSLATALADNGTPAAGSAWDLVTLVTAIRTVSGGLILLNIATRNSAALLRTALVTDPDVRVVVVGVSDDDDEGVIRCAEAGAAGYHTRRQSFQELLEVMCKVAAGEPSCSARVSGILLRRLATLGSQRHPGAQEMVLTAREVQIFGMLKLGLSNREIAAQLCIAVHTVKNHVHSLLTKLNVRTRIEAATLPHVSQHYAAAPVAAVASWYRPTAGISSTPESTTASSRLGAVSVPSIRAVLLPDAGLERLAGEHHAGETRAVAADPRGVAVEEAGRRVALQPSCRRCTARAGSACGKPAAAANSGSECSGLRSPHMPVQQRLLRRRRDGRARSRVRARGGSDRRRRAALAAEAALAAGEDRPLLASTAACRRASSTVVSDQITAALPLSQMSVNRVTAMPVPDGGIGPGTVTASLACSTLDSSMSMPGNCTVGGSVMWKLCATLPNVGSTCGVSSVR